MPTAEVLFRRTGRQFFLADGAATSGSGAAGAGAGVAAAVPGATGRRGLRTAAPSATSAASSATAAAASTATASADFNAPLLYRLTSDDLDRGAFFYSALAAFRSRTAYANTGRPATRPAGHQPAIGS